MPFGRKRPAKLYCMQQEFMLYVRNAGDAKASMSAGDHLAFVKSCESYIGKLKSNGNLIAAQPIMRKGCTVLKQGSDWAIEPLDVNDSVQVGYYHILAKDLDEAIEIAKENPEFEFVPSASVEIRPVKMKEEQTAFAYPR